MNINEEIKERVRRCLNDLRDSSSLAHEQILTDMCDYFYKLGVNEAHKDWMPEAEDFFYCYADKRLGEKEDALYKLLQRIYAKGWEDCLEKNSIFIEQLNRHKEKFF